MNNRKLISFISILIFGLLFSACNNSTGPNINESINGTWEKPIIDEEGGREGFMYMIIQFPNLKQYITHPDKSCYVLEEYTLEELSGNEYSMTYLKDNSTRTVKINMQDNSLIVKLDKDTYKFKSSDKEPATFEICN